MVGVPPLHSGVKWTFTTNLTWYERFGPNLCKHSSTTEARRKRNQCLQTAAAASWCCLYMRTVRERCSSVVKAFAHGALGRRIDPS